MTKCPRDWGLHCPRGCHNARGLPGLQIRVDLTRSPDLSMCLAPGSPGDDWNQGEQGDPPPNRLGRQQTPAASQTARIYQLRRIMCTWR